MKKKDLEATAADDAAGGIRRMLSEKQILEIVPYSPVTLWRMEKQGRFPEHSNISPNRKIWFEDQIIAWQRDVERRRHRRPPPDKS